MQIEEAKKTLREYIENFYKSGIEIVKKPDIIKVIDYKEIQAIETVLNYIDIMHKELDRLEGIEDNTAMLKEEMKKFAQDNVLLSIENMNSIPISVIQNKIDELESYRFASSLHAKKGYTDKIKLLQELLEERNK